MGTGRLEKALTAGRSLAPTREAQIHQTLYCDEYRLMVPLDYFLLSLEAMGYSGRLAGRCARFRCCRPAPETLRSPLPVRPEAAERLWHGDRLSLMLEFA